MPEPLIRGKAGVAGTDYLLRFYDWRTQWNPYMLYDACVADGGSALAELQSYYDEALSYVENWQGYRLGQAISAYDENYRQVPGSGALETGVEVVLRYAGSTSGYGVYLSLVPNGPTYIELLQGTFEAGADGELEVRILCLPELLRVTVNGVTESEMNPATFDWGRMEPPPYYWLFLMASAPYVDAVEQAQPQSIDFPWLYFRAAEIPHIREIAYYAASGGPALFFTDFVRSYERR